MLLNLGISVVICFLCHCACGNEDVRFPPSIKGGPLGSEDLIYFLTDETMVLRCDASGIPKPSIDWYVLTYGVSPVDLNKPNVELQDDGSLKIDRMTSLDEGEYYCTATNPNGKAMSRTVNLKKATLGRLPPSAVQTYTGTEGQPLMVPCQEVKSVPEAVYSWAQVQTEDDENPRSLLTDERIVMSPLGYLYFANLEKSDDRGGALYTCSVFNPVLDIMTRGSYARVIVEPVENVETTPPQLEFPTDWNQPQIVALLGEEFELQCIFSGFPTPAVTWSRVGRSLPAGRWQTQDHGTTLRVEGVTHRDEGTYTCEGANSRGGSSQNISVTVEAKPRFASDDVFHSLNLTVGSTANFICLADFTTKPAPEIDLLINSVPLDDQFPGPRRTVSYTESGGYGKILRIDNVCRDCVGGGTDLMAIQCRIRNKYGSVFKSVYLNVVL